MRLLELNTAPMTKLAGKKIKETLRQDCKEAINMLSQNHTMFGKCQVKNIAEKKNAAECDTLNEVFEIFGEGIENKNGILVTNENAYGTNVIMPIGEFKFIWNENMANPTDYLNEKEFYNPNDDLIKEFKETSLKEIQTFYRDDLKEKQSSHWRTYFEEKARDKLNALPAEDPDHYNSDVDETVNRWLTHYQKNIDEELDQGMKNPDLVNMINTELEEKYQAELEGNFHNFNSFDRERFIESQAKHYNIVELQNGLEFGNGVLLLCDSYYAIDTNFYNYFIKEQLYG